MRTGWTGPTPSLLVNENKEKHMFQITETTHQGDFHKVVRRAGVTMRAALDAVLSDSAYNGGMGAADRDRVSKGLVHKGDPVMYHGWATYTVEFRLNLEDSPVTYMKYGQEYTGLVMIDSPRTAPDGAVVRNDITKMHDTIKHTDIIRYADR